MQYNLSDADTSTATIATIMKAHTNNRFPRKNRDSNQTSYLRVNSIQVQSHSQLYDNMQTAANAFCL